MVLEWLGGQRNVIESIFLWSNVYAARHTKPFKLMEDVELNASEIQVVEYLLENEELKLNMAGVAKRLGISPSSFTILVSKLEKMGLVEKYYCGDNRKNMIVIVTDKGHKVYDKYADNLSKLWNEDVLKPLSEIPEEYLEKFSLALNNMSERTLEIYGGHKETLTPVKKSPVKPHIK